MRIKQLLPANDWFWVGSGIDGKPIVQQVAVWVVDENDDGDRVIGMIALAVTNVVNPEPPRLVMPPHNVLGSYKHRDDLTAEETAAI